MIQKGEISQGKYVAKQEKIDFITNLLEQITKDKFDFNKISDLEPYFSDTKFTKIFNLWVKDEN